MSPECLSVVAGWREPAGEGVEMWFAQVYDDVYVKSRPSQTEGRGCEGANDHVRCSDFVQSTHDVQIEAQDAHPT